jgi:hypothetical protein
MATKLSSPSLLRCRKKEEGDGSKAAIAFFDVLQQNKKKGDDSVTVIAFWATLQEKN